MAENSSNPITKIAIIGGTGKEGKGIAYRWARVGHTILIGSRQLERAQTAAEEIRSLLEGKCKVVGMTNLDAAQAGEIVVLTVPFSAQKDILETIKKNVQGKIVINVTVPLVPPKITRVQMPPAGSACQEAQQILGEQTQVIAAFQNISYENLINKEDIGCDVLVCGGNKEGRARVIDLIRGAGLEAWDAGPVENAMVVEGMTSILLGINKQYGGQSAGIKITGISGKSVTG